MMRVRSYLRQPRMFALFNRYLDLVMMRLPPQAFPASRFLLGLVAVAFMLVGVVATYVLSGTLGWSLLRVILSVITLSGFAAVVLAVTNRQARWQQTATALLGGEAVIGLVQLPVLIAWASGIDNIFIALSLLLFLAWELVFLAHVYRNALDRSMGIGMLVAIGYIVVSMLVEQAVLPFPEDAGMAAAQEGVQAPGEEQD